MSPSARPPDVLAWDAYDEKVVKATSVAELSELMSGLLGVPVDLSGGDLYYSKFVAAAAKQWHRHRSADSELVSFEYSDRLPPHASGGAGAGFVRLSLAQFGAERREALDRATALLGIAHLLDDVPEYAAVAVVLHELSHIDAIGLSRSLRHDFMPSFLRGDLTAHLAHLDFFRQVLEVRAKSIGEPADSVLPVIAALAREALDLSRSDHLLYAIHPQLRHLNDEVVATLVSEYGGTSNGEAFAEARAKLHLAGREADRASHILGRLGPGYDAIVDDAPRFRAHMAYMRHRLDPRTGFETDNPVARAQEIQREHLSVGNRAAAAKSLVKAALPLGPFPRRPEPTMPVVRGAAGVPGRPAVTTDPGQARFPDAPRPVGPAHPVAHPSPAGDSGLVEPTIIVNGVPLPPVAASPGTAKPAAVLPAAGAGLSAVTRGAARPAASPAKQPARTPRSRMPRSPTRTAVAADVARRAGIRTPLPPPPASPARLGVGAVRGMAARPAAPGTTSGPGMAGNPAALPDTFRPGRTPLARTREF
ncbi:MAG: hypothetical protein HOV68_24155 [Streptomycetaceae bacterium]|nr:hypothetical protein [Streptomycetaceae bacterium]